MMKQGQTHAEALSEATRVSQHPTDLMWFYLLMECMCRCAALLYTCGEQRGKAPRVPLSHRVAEELRRASLGTLSQRPAEHET